jgi:hypothetical protein
MGTALQVVMNKKRVAVLLPLMVTLAVVLLAGFLWPRSETRNTAEQGASYQAHGNVESLREWVRSARAGRKWAPTEQPPMAEAAAPQDQDKDPVLRQDPMEAQNYREALTIRQVQLAQLTWKLGRPDNEWTARMTQHVKEQFSKHDIRGTITSVECRTTLCRVTMEFASYESMSTVDSVIPPEHSDGISARYADGDRKFLRYYFAPAGVGMRDVIKDDNF